MGVTASFQPTTVAVTPGTSATVDVRVRNTGHIVDVLTVEVVGEAAAWATVTPPSVSLFPGNDQTVTVVFTPPMSADGPSGSVPFGVRVRSQEDPNGTVVEEGVLEVASFLAVSAELQPRTSRGRKGAVHELAIDNRGTQPVSVRLGATDPDANLVFAFEPPALEVPANSAAFVKVKLRAAHPFRKGTSLTRMFSVVVSDASGAADPLAVAAGMFVQEETFPRWVRRALLWAVLGLIAFLLFWFLLGKPAVESVAKEAVADSSTPPTIADSSGSGAGSGAGGGGAGSENTDAGGADVSTGSSTGAGATTTIDGRLFLTEAGVSAYEVPAGSTLQVTDIVLQNPTGDTGSLQIRRNGTALLVVELGNFRDLDYHFVAPIVFTAGQKLELAATCTAGACTPGAYFAGYLIQGG